MRLQNFLPLRRRRRLVIEPTEQNRDERLLPGDRLSTLALWAILMSRP
jgi:hypothetical protein